MDTGQEKRKWLETLVLAGLCNVMHFAISWILLIMKSNVGGGVAWGKNGKRGTELHFLVSYGAN